MLEDQLIDMIAEIIDPNLFQWEQWERDTPAEPLWTPGRVSSPSSEWLKTERMILMAQAHRIVQKLKILQIYHPTEPKTHAEGQRENWNFIKPAPGPDEVYACPICGTIVVFNCYHDNSGTVTSTLMKEEEAYRLQRTWGGD